METPNGIYEGELQERMWPLAARKINGIGPKTDERLHALGVHTIGGMGDDTLVGGLGADAFAVHPGSGDDVIRDFTAGPGIFDHLALHELRWEDLSFPGRAAAGVTIRWDGGSVRLEGVRQADPSQDDFMFAESPDLPPGSREPSGPAAERATMIAEGPQFEDRGLPREMLDQFLDAKLRHSANFLAAGQLVAGHAAHHDLVVLVTLEREIALIDILPAQVTVTDTAEGASVSWDTDGDATANGTGTNTD